MISIILPVRNEADFISKTIDAILAQDYPQNQIEILISDGMSTDGTRESIWNYQQPYPQIHLINNPCGIVPTGLNAAIRQAVGDFIIRIDGHTLIAPDYVSKCIDTLQRTTADNVGGCMTADGNTIFRKVVSITTSTPFGVGNSKFHYAKAEEEVDSVYMGAWRKEVFHRIGLFDEELVRNQDDEFNYRLKETGGKIILNPEIKSLYTPRGTPLSLWKQYFQYGYWKVRVLQKHPRQMSLRQFAPPALMFALIASLLLLFFPTYRLVSTLVPLAYLLANLTATIWTSKKNGWQYLAHLPPVFAILHFSYGLGFIFGLFKFSKRWGDRVGKTPQPDKNWKECATQ